MPLTPKQLRYIQNRVTGMGSREAAIKAGYVPDNADVSAARLNKNPRIVAEIAKANDRVFMRAEVTAEDIVREAWDIAQDASIPAAARVSALALLAKRHREFSDKREIDVRAISLIANTYGVAEEELLDEAHRINLMLKAGNQDT